jgi:hypothetical protein
MGHDGFGKRPLAKQRVSQIRFGGGNVFWHLFEFGKRPDQAQDGADVAFGGRLDAKF